MSPLHHGSALLALGLVLSACATPPAPKPQPMPPLSFSELDADALEPALAVDADDAHDADEGRDGDAAEEVAQTQPPEVPPVAAAPLAGPEQVAVWREGEQVALIDRDQAEQRGLIVLDLGRRWVPRLFRSTPAHPNDYEPSFIDYANGRFDEDRPEGRRAAQERYLEPYGIPPSPALLAQRFRTLADKPCASRLPLERLRAFRGVEWPEGKQPARAVPQPVIDALQTRLVCEEHLRQWPSGELDDATREALAEFERRNRIYGRGDLSGDTLDALRLEPLELERRALARVLTERLILDLGVIEDSSAWGAVSRTAHGPVEDSPDVARRVHDRVVAALGLSSVEGVRHFYGRLADAFARPHYGLALEPITLPDYYSDDMDVWVEIDRGDLYYEFPFHEDGTPIDFRIDRGPTLTLFARDGRKIRPLALYRTTIGGWRIRRYHGADYWEYKESPVGSRVWARVEAAPVWLPPASTPPQSLVVTLRRTSDGSTFRELNYNLIGPGFASAYGLVAAYHQRYGHASDGDLELGDDDGIRTHGSSDYTSIWRRSSSGCHRLHNHVALRLFNFLLAHRPYRRTGERALNYRLPVQLEDFRDEIVIRHSGYGFDFERPVPVKVLRGRVRGELQRAIRRRIPVEDEDRKRLLAIEPSGPGPS